MKKLFSFFIITAVSFLIAKPIFGSTLPFTHDSQNHLARIANFYLALRQGQIPPRWAPNLNNAFGYPALNYNYPLANIFSMPFIILGFSIETTFKLITFISLLGSGIFMFLFLNQYFKEKHSLIGSILYLLSPYQLSLIFTRGVIGETLSFSFLPLLLLMINKYTQHPNKKRFFILALTSSCYLLTHNIIVLFSTPLILSYALIATNSRPNHLKLLVTPALISLMLVSFFWLPAIFEKQYTNIDQTPLVSEYNKHFPSLGQLFYSGEGYAFSQPGPVDGFSLSIGIFNLIFIFLSLVVVVKIKHIPKIILFFTTIFFISIFLMQPSSNFLYQSFFLLQYIQFPWRLLFFTAFSSAIIASWVSEKLFSNKIWLIMTVLLTVIYLKSASFPVGFSYDDLHWFNFSLTTSTKNENMPIWFDPYKNFDFWSQKHREGWDKFVVDLNNQAELKILSWDGTKHHYFVKSQKPIHLVERTAYFPGWLMKANGQGQPINFHHEDFPGAITTQLSPGNYEIITRFTQKTPSRIIGNTLTFLGLFLLVVLWKLRQPFLVKTKIL